MSTSLFRPGEGRDGLRVSPAATGWQHLDFEVLALTAGERVERDAAGRELAIVAISGAGVVEVGTETFELSRRGVFDEPGGLLYLPPGTSATLAAADAWHVAIGSAPAEGRYPLRLVTPEEVRVELRGGGPARRQVNHLLAPPLPAERLIVYEVFVPGGSWAGWPPHCHDGWHGSPYLEETYYFRFDRFDGFGFHRNYLADGSHDEAFAVRDGDCVTVPRGFHVTTAAPGNNMWILNFLAGELLDEARATPPYFDSRSTWIADDWSKGQIELPVGVPARAGSPARP
ncbi:MAG TPA: 5-deoxy-glucuronate isomerase [Conexibacter sp.]